MTPWHFEMTQDTSVDNLIVLEITTKLLVLSVVIFVEYVFVDR